MAMLPPPTAPLQFHLTSTLLAHGFWYLGLELSDGTPVRVAYTSTPQMTVYEIQCKLERALLVGTDMADGEENTPNSKPAIPVASRLLERHGLYLRPMPDTRILLSKYARHRALNRLHP
jgi:hypothetical protein